MARKKRKKALVLQWIEFAIFRVVQGLLRWLPGTFVFSLGRGLGRVGFHLARSRTRLALKNIARAMPDLQTKERERIVQDCWAQFVAETFSYVRTIDAAPDDPRMAATLENSHHLDRVREENAGVVIYSAHFGAWESAIAVIRKVDLSCAVVARPLDNELLEDLLQRGRRRFGVEMVPKRNAARALVRRLSSGEGVLVLPDQAVRPREGILVPFLGHPAWTTSAPARLALRYGAPILGAFCYRREGRVVAELTEPILTAGLEESEENVVRLTREINDQISARIRETPSLWLWMHDRWKNVDEKELAT